MGRLVWLATGLGLVLTLLLACTSPEGQLVYTGPTEVTVLVGEYIPGTDIQFVGKGSEGAQVLIEGQPALKKLGDSLNWSGTVSEGVHIQVRLRVLHIAPERLLSGGTVRITVKDPAPEAGPTNKPRPIRYTVPVTYKVNRGDLIPGTTIVYTGREKGKGARLEGVGGYPYRAIGDSIVWDGALRSNVDLHLSLRLLFFNDSFMQVMGLATVSITP